MKKEKSSLRKLFIQWFIIFAASLSGGIIALNTGLLSLFIKNDQSYICLIIMSLYLVASAIAGHLCFRIDQLKKNVVEKQVKLLEFFSENFFVLGLLGTIIGFCIMMYQSVGGTGTPDTTQIILALKSGLATAFYTTLVGIVCSLGLQLQLFIVNRYTHE